MKLYISFYHGKMLVEQAKVLQTILKEPTVFQQQSGSR